MRTGTICFDRLRNSDGRSWATPWQRRTALLEETLEHLLKVEELRVEHIAMPQFSYEPPPETPGLLWYYRTKDWGFPHSGGWADQPVGFMEDMWTIEVAVKSAGRASDVNRQSQLKGEQEWLSQVLTMALRR